MAFRRKTRCRQAMTVLRDKNLRTIVLDLIAEQRKLHRDDLEAIALKAMATTLTSFGIHDDDRKEFRADMEHLRRWRRSAEQIQTYVFRVVIAVIVTGFVGAAWLGIKVMFGK